MKNKDIFITALLLANIWAVGGTEPIDNLTAFIFLVIAGFGFFGLLNEN